MSEISKEQYVKKNRLAICAILRDLKKNNTAIMVTHSRGQFISRILEVHPDANQFIFDFGSVERENLLAQDSEQLTFIAEPAGAKIEFSCTTQTEITYFGLPAFSSPIPDSLYFIQRREYFRINIPQWPPFYCTGKFPNGTAFKHTLTDISLGGVGMFSNKDSELPLEGCEILRGSLLDLGEFGSFDLDLQFIRAVDKKVISNKGETVTMTRLSFKFPKLSPMQEKGLQRAIFELEKQQSFKSRKFQDGI
ncbi:flagellar brake protein [Yersinia entomophaga]|uniref:Flagellar brake protein YcgR n=1 Tax=Yersinia entomophaga TaxID=935293 RepID=A0ABM6BIX0_YERET|nr:MULTISPECIES: flagellar brake protein [Yersinia]ANI29504.1 flagellar brake protein [Yersinia entomophaga]OWF86915.1 flagellar brake protein [Yersinia entomophaga]